MLAKDSPLTTTVGYRMPHDPVLAKAMNVQQPISKAAAVAGRRPLIMPPPMPKSASAKALAGAAPPVPKAPQPERRAAGTPVELLPGATVKTKPKVRVSSRLKSVPLVQPKGKGQ